MNKQFEAGTTTGIVHFKLPRGRTVFFMTANADGYRFGSTGSVESEAVRDYAVSFYLNADPDTYPDYEGVLDSARQDVLFRKTKSALMWGYHELQKQ